MTKEELIQLWTLLKKLKKERILKCVEEDPETNFQQFDDDDWYDYDDGDNLIYGCDVVLGVVEDRLIK